MRACMDTGIQRAAAIVCKCRRALRRRRCVCTCFYGHLLSACAKQLCAVRFSLDVRGGGAVSPIWRRRPPDGDQRPGDGDGEPVRDRMRLEEYLKAFRTQRRSNRRRLAEVEMCHNTISDSLARASERASEPTRRRISQMERVHNRQLGSGFQ